MEECNWLISDYKKIEYLLASLWLLCVQLTALMPHTSSFIAEFLQQLKVMNITVPTSILLKLKNRIHITVFWAMVLCNLSGRCSLELYPVHTPE